MYLKISLQLIFMPYRAEATVFGSLIIINGYIPFRKLRRALKDFRLVLSPQDSDIFHEEYRLKKDDEIVGWITLARKKEFQVSDYISLVTEPGIVIEIDYKYKDDVINSLKGIVDLRRTLNRCPACGSRKPPIAKRTPASYGRKPYSTELSYNCPDCGYEYWPERGRRS